MKRNIAAGLSIVAVVAGVGWKLASRPTTSTALEDIRLIQRSEHSHPGPTNELAGIRIRISLISATRTRCRPARFHKSPWLPNRPGGVA